MSKAAIPKGARDFGPVQMSKRNYIFNIIKEVFEVHGFSPIETPAMELRETLMGKYGEEGDRLIFNVLSRGQKFKEALLHSAEKVGFEGEANFNEATYFGKFSNEALRYDLTVPFARFVVQHRNDLTFPFKRYQIQPVWRADRPQKGRYREFYQCDVDMIGSDSLWNEVELIQIIKTVFDKLRLPDVDIKLNNRKILSGIAEVIGEADKIVNITVALDKLDKIGREGVVNEMRGKGVSEEAIEKLSPLFELSGSTQDKIEKLKQFLSNSEIGMKGLTELAFIFEQCESLNVQNVSLDVTLARGLNYYTGAIFEVQHVDFPSSITGGGRYADLTGIFGLKDMSGVGISLGADRIYDLLEEKKLFPERILQQVKLLFINFGENEAGYCMKLMSKLREIGISTEMYPDSAKMKKQMKYANDKAIPFVALIGETEMENETITLKNMESGNQESLTIEEIIEQLKK